MLCQQDLLICQIVGLVQHFVVRLCVLCKASLLVCGSCSVQDFFVNLSTICVCCLSGGRLSTKFVCCLSGGGLSTKCVC